VPKRAVPNLAVVPSVVLGFEDGVLEDAGRIPEVHTTVPDVLQPLTRSCTQGQRRPTARTSYRCAVSQSFATYTGTSARGSGGRPRIRSAAFSASMIVGAFRLPLTMLGMIEASTTRRPSTP
jgi:hypothetical protein